MVTKRNKLVYEFNNVTTSQTINIDFNSLDISDGNTFDTLAAAYFIDTVVLSVNATNTGTDKRKCGLGVGSSVATQTRRTLEEQDGNPNTPETAGGNVDIVYSSNSLNTLTITLNLNSATSTDMRVFVEILGYSND